MNWSDFLVIGIIAGFGVIGLANGFLMSVFRLVSYFVSIILSLKFYPVVSEILIKTSLYTNIKASILRGLLLQRQELAPKADAQAKQAAADAVIGHLKLPGFLKEMLINKVPNPSSLIDVSKIMDMISAELAKIVVSIISLVVLYILIRIVLSFAKLILKGIARLPLFKQMDKLGGFAFGAVEGLLTVYIIFAIVLLFNASPQFRGLYDALSSSVFAGFFYQNNFIVDWMFPTATLGT